MRAKDFLDKGASIDADAVCVIDRDRSYTFDELCRLSHRIGHALRRSGVNPGDNIAMLTRTHALTVACYAGIGRAGAASCPIDPLAGDHRLRETISVFDCRVLIFDEEFSPQVARLRRHLTRLGFCVSIGPGSDVAITLDDWIGDTPDRGCTAERDDDIAIIAATHASPPRGVMLSTRNLETLSAVTLMACPFHGRPSYLLTTDAPMIAQLLALPVLALGGCVVIERPLGGSDLLRCVQARRITHAMPAPDALEQLIDAPGLAEAGLDSLQCIWYLAGTLTPQRIEAALTRIGPVLAQLFALIEVPIVSLMAPADHFADDGSIALDRLRSVGRAAPLMQLAVLDPEGTPLPSGAVGQVAVRGSIVTTGYYDERSGAAAPSRARWHATGMPGRIDADGYLYLEYPPASSADPVSDAGIGETAAPSGRASRPDATMSNSE